MHFKVLVIEITKPPSCLETLPFLPHRRNLNGKESQDPIRFFFCYPNLASIQLSKGDHEGSEG